MERFVLTDAQWAKMESHCLDGRLECRHHPRRRELPLRSVAGGAGARALLIDRDQHRISELKSLRKEAFPCLAWKLQRPLHDGALKVVMTGEKEDAA
jgi:hypothetical protein